MKNLFFFFFILSLASCGTSDSNPHESGQSSSMSAFDVTSIEEPCGCATAMKKITHELFNNIEEGVDEEDFESLPKNKVLIEKFNEVDDYCDEKFDRFAIKECSDYSEFKVNMEKIEEQFR